MRGFCAILQPQPPSVSVGIYQADGWLAVLCCLHIHVQLRTYNEIVLNMDNASGNSAMADFALPWAEPSEHLSRHVLITVPSVEFNSCWT